MMPFFFLSWDSSSLLHAPVRMGKLILEPFCWPQVKRNIMLRMADACQESTKSQRFQEMYVQRHNNVRYVSLDVREVPIGLRHLGLPFQEL